MFKQIYKLFQSNSLYEQALNKCHKMLDIDLLMFKTSVESLRKSDLAHIDIEHSRNLISSVVNPFERIGYPE